MTRLRVVMQARTASSRLPAKALLPLAGMPSALLAGLRAKRGGLDFVFATSNDPTDDHLAATAAKAGLTVFRGSKDDVLARYAAAAADLAETDTVVRITGDDPVPDGDFLRLVAGARAKQGVDMLSCLSPLDGLPHGLAAQAFTVAALRRAAASATEPYDREHVGPWMLRQPSSAIFSDLIRLDAGHLRCTLDSIDDYFDLLRLFDGAADPIGVSWRELVEKLRARSNWAGMPFRYLRGKPGGEAGVERLGALVPDAEGASVESLRHAIRCGATHLVASPGKGQGALLAGGALAQGWSGRANAILRLHPWPAELPRARLEDWTDAAILAGLRDLGLYSVHTLVVTPPSGARGMYLIEHVEKRRVEGWFRHIGVAVDNVAAARRWLKHPAVVHIEFACDPDERAPSLARLIVERPEIMVLARPRDTVEPAAIARLLARKWVHGVVVRIGSNPQYLADLVNAVRERQGARR